MSNVEKRNIYWRSCLKNYVVMKNCAYNVSNAGKILKRLSQYYVVMRNCAYNVSNVGKRSIYWSGCLKNYVVMKTVHIICPVLEKTVFTEGAVSRLCSDEKSCTWYVQCWKTQGLSQNYVVMKNCAYNVSNAGKHSICWRGCLSIM